MALIGIVILLSLPQAPRPADPRPAPCLGCGCALRSDGWRGAPVP